MTTKEKFNALRQVIENGIPDDCEVRFWINNCTRQELYILATELGVNVEMRSGSNRLYLPIEIGTHEITLWE